MIENKQYYCPRCGTDELHTDIFAHGDKFHPTFNIEYWFEYVFTMDHPDVDLIKLLGLIADKKENLSGIRNKNIDIDDYVLYIREQNKLNPVKKKKYISAILKKDRVKTKDPIVQLENTIGIRKTMADGLNHTKIFPAEEALLRIKFIMTQQDIARAALDISMGLKPRPPRNPEIVQDQEEKCFVSPEGNVVSYDKLVDFCKEHGLRRQKMTDLKAGRVIKNHKGWKRYLPEDHV